MRILFIGDVFGSPGRKIVREHVHHLVETNNVELLIINVENAAGGFGVTPAICEEFFELGADVLTTGNHVWDKKEINDYLNSGMKNGSSARRVLRPANYPATVPGSGHYQGTTRSGVPYAVINLQGRVFMVHNDDPFRTADRLIDETKAKVIVVDLHAEATSEKVAMGWYLDGRVTAVLGTHTHVATADTRVLPNGTAYQTDVGMSGPHDGVIGVEKEQVISRFLTSMPNRFDAARGDVRLNGVLIDCDAKTGKANSIERISLGQ
ncbi:MAG TPA: TIGR00282 family metallophosphoesterase [Terriglobales bacterium]|nr:TIGR00282 family metallophosphoesterase [Terriglobales bacterium]